MTPIIMTAGLAALLFFACDQEGKKVSARFKFQPDMKLSYEQITRGSVRDYKADSLTWDGHSEVTMYIEWFVRRVLEDKTSEIVETKKVKRKSFNAKDSLVNDSSKISESTPLIMYVQPDGKLVDIKPASGEMKYDVSYLKSYYEQCLPVFPKHDLQVGYSWTQTTKVILPDGPMDASTTYTFKSFARERGYDCVVVEYDGLAVVPLAEMEWPAEEESTDNEKSNGKEKAEKKKSSGKLLGGIDRISASGNLYFAYKEGVMVSLRERWLLNGDRRTIDCEGDTTTGRIELEYDVDYYLTKLETE